MHMVEALGRVIAGDLDEDVVRPFHVSEAAAARRLYALGAGLGDLRFCEADRVAGIRPGVAADQHRAALIGGVERQQFDSRTGLVGFERSASVGDVPAEMPDRAL